MGHTPGHRMPYTALLDNPSWLRGHALQSGHPVLPTPPCHTVSTGQPEQAQERGFRQPGEEGGAWGPWKEWAGWRALGGGGCREEGAASAGPQETTAPSAPPLAHSHGTLTGCSLGPNLHLPPGDRESLPIKSSP